MKIMDVLERTIFSFSFREGIDIVASMKSPLIPISLAALLFGAIQAHSQSSVNFNFSDGTADGWAVGGFSSTPAASVVAAGGNNYIFLPIGGFQVGNVAHGADGSDFYNAMLAAAANPSLYNLTYNWRVDTSTFGANAGTFLQVGSFVNSGSGFYAQDFTTPEVALSGAQLTSGQVFSGTVSINFAAVGFTPPATDTFFRLGFIENGDGTAPVGVQFTDISVAPVPEPSSLALIGLAAPAWWMMRCRRAARG